MPADPFDIAAELIIDALHATDAGMVRAKCPRCRRWCLRQRSALTQPCYLCLPVPGVGTFADLLLMIEQRLSPAAYHARLDKYGPPWISPKEWSTPRTRLRKLSRPADD